MSLLGMMVRFPLTEDERDIIFWVTVVLGIVTIIIDIIAFVKTSRINKYTGKHFKPKRKKRRF